MDLTKVQKSFLKFIYALSNLAIAASIFIAVVIIAMSIFQMFTDISRDDGKMHFNGPTLFSAELKLQDQSEITDDLKFSLNDIEAKMDIKSNSIELQIFKIVIVIIIALIQFLIIYLIRNIIKTFVNENPFIYENIKRLKIIAAIIFITPLAINIFTFLFLLGNSSGAMVYGSFKVIPKPLFGLLSGFNYAVIIYLFALAFQKGFKLEKDQELTV